MATYKSHSGIWSESIKDFGILGLKKIRTVSQMRWFFLSGRQNTFLQAPKGQVQQTDLSTCKKIWTTICSGGSKDFLYAASTSFPDWLTLVCRCRWVTRCDVCFHAESYRYNMQYSATKCLETTKHLDLSDVLWGNNVFHNFENEGRKTAHVTLRSVNKTRVRDLVLEISFLRE